MLSVFMGIAAWSWVAAGPIFLEGSGWRYWKGTSTPPVQGSLNWTDSLYTHTNWLQGNSGFGYGDNDDTTVLSDMQNNYISIFTRKKFGVSNVVSLTHLTLAVDYDDGFVAYINGQEVARGNMPTGTITRHTAAADNHECSRPDDAGSVDSNDKEYFTIDPSVLNEGSNNVIAVSGHNISTNSSDFTLIVELYTNVTLLRGPFIQMPDDDGVAICWRTDAATDSVVDYGTDLTYGLGTVSNGTPVRDHVVKITGLDPGTSYFYRVSSAGNILSAGAAFRTRAVSTQAIRFAVYGDFGSGSAAMTEVANRLGATNVDFSITVGDNIYLHGQPGDYDRYWFTPYTQTMSRSATFPALGNHDSEYGNNRWMANFFVLPTNGPAGMEELVYSFDYGPAHFSIVDSVPFEPSTVDTAKQAAIRTWLTNDLANVTNLWKFVVYHHPPYTTTGSHGENSGTKAGLAPICEQYGVHVVFQGHNHFYERINPINAVHYITSGGGGQSLNGYSTRQIYSAYINNTIHSFTIVELDGTTMNLRALDKNGAILDRYTLDLNHPFKMDGILDNPAWALSSNVLGTIKLYAAIRSNLLYVAGQDAPPPSNGNNDHFIYIQTNINPTLIPANWGKGGSNIQWSAFLGDESVNGFIGWFGPTQNILTNPAIYRAVSSGLFENGTNQNGAMEGTINLTAHFGQFPPELCLAFAPYATADGGSLLWEYQIPPAGAGNNINSSEYLRVSTRSLALDLPVADAGSDQNVEAGMTAQVDGSNSSAPSGFPLTYAWAQVSGPPVLLGSPNLPVTSVQATNPVDGVSNVVLRLVVNDTRFDSTDTVVVAVSPIVDSDGDGLSDTEELTGVDNPLTVPNPAGIVTDPNAADTDGDGLTDGQEAIAGTDPNNPADVLKIVEEQKSAGEAFVIRWPSASNRLYHVNSVTDLIASGVSRMATNVSATPPVNAHTVPVEQAERQFFIIEVQP